MDLNKVEVNIKNLFVETIAKIKTDNIEKKKII
jgi:hypothetical protein